jgi:hypothetical protein
MSVGSVSFLQQAQSYWSSTQGPSAALDNSLSTAESNLGKGLASIANSTALKRVNSQITALVEQALGVSGSSSSGSAGTSATSSSSTASSAGAPATATSKAILTTSTSLSTLGILPGGTITVGSGANTTTYTSTGTDTVGDLINAINVDLPTNANVTASINSTGHLVITSRDKTDSIFIGGSGTDATAIGFGLGNNTFLPKAPSTPAPSASSNSSTASSSSPTTSSTASSSKAAYTVPAYLALSEQTGSSALSLLADSGVSGSLVNLLT